MSEAARDWSNEVKDLGDKIMGLTLLKAQELGDYLKDVYGIEAAAAPVIAAGPALAGGGAAPAAEAEKEDFSVVLTGSGDKKIQVIKVIRELTGLGLKEAKDLVDGAPKTVKEDVPKAQAEDMKKKIEEAGGTVELK
ncbi:50S ribosomal protein L7/L12 [bacterium]|nr:50S ribosomal protein L7/L12 [bacterium]